MYSENHRFHITCRSLNKEFFPIPRQEVWDLTIKELSTEAREHLLCIHAFVLMGNHFHLLCHTPRRNLDQIVERFLYRTSKAIGHPWEASHGRSLIKSRTHYFQVYRYIYQNPIRAGICQRVEDYPYSTLRPCPLPIHSFIPFSFGGAEGELLWLNEKYESEDQELIKLGLRMGQFDLGERRLKACHKLRR